MLTAVLPFHGGDLAQAKNLLSWINELGGCKRHGLVLAADEKVDSEVVKEMKASAQDDWRFVRAIKISIPPELQGYPKVSNFMFCKCVEYVFKNLKTPFLWLEPDCVPLKLGWLDKLDEQYIKCPTRFMGAIIEGGDCPGMPEFHLTGCAIYPQDTHEFFNLRGKPCIACDEPLDVLYAAQQVAASSNTNLLQQFCQGGSAGLNPHYSSLALVKKKAVMFHPDKYHSLIPKLRKKLKLKEKL